MHAVHTIIRTLISPLENFVTCVNVTLHKNSSRELTSLFAGDNKKSNVPVYAIFQIGQESSGQCIPVQCDHGNDEEVKQLFDKVSREQNGRLDVLVNNAYKGVSVKRMTIKHTGSYSYFLLINSREKLSPVNRNQSYHSGQSPGCRVTVP